MSFSSSSDPARAYDRAFLLSDAKRNDVLGLSEVLRYGRDSFDDPDYVTIYGLKPADWYARGIRLLARTAVECTRDLLADRIGRDIARVARAAPDVLGSVVLDPFAGSGNTLFWIRRHLEARTAIGLELDTGVFEASARNLAFVDDGIELRHEGFETGLKALRMPADELVVVFVAPPWGDALSVVSGLDLRRTTPPVGGIVDLLGASFGSNKLLVAIQVHEAIHSRSLDELTARFDWVELRIYDIDMPGHNHGILIGTRGWAPDAAAGRKP